MTSGRNAAKALSTLRSRAPQRGVKRSGRPLNRWTVRAPDPASGARGPAGLGLRAGGGARPGGGAPAAPAGHTVRSGRGRSRLRRMAQDRHIVREYLEALIIAAIFLQFANTFVVPA